MKAIILARVSTEEQMTEGQSIPAQLERAREYAKRKSLEVVSEYQFDESSLKDKRTKFDKVIDEIKKSKENIALIVETVDRLQRSFKESVMLDEHRKSGKLELHFIRENLVIHKDSNSSEIQRWDLAVFVAKSFVLQISDNVKRTIEKRVKNGECSNKAPIGYLNTEDKQGNKIVVADPERSHYVKRVFDLYSTGRYSMKKLVEIMAEEGLTSNMPVPNKLRLSQIERMLKNPFYYGQMIYKGELYPHRYEPLVGYDVWKKCKDVRDGYDKTVKNTNKPFVFQGLMKCAHCGCAITAELAKGRYIYYHCTNHKGNCKKVYVNQDELLKPIEAILGGMSLPQARIDVLVADLRKLEESKNMFHIEQLKALRQQCDKVEKRMSVMYEDRLDGRLSADQYDQMIKEYESQKYDLDFKIKQLSNANKAYYITAGQVLSLAQRAGEIFKSSTIEEKRQLLGMLFQNLKLNGEKLEYKLKTPFAEVFLANTTLNWGA